MVLYFAYGSNMNAGRMAARVPSARKLGVGHISGWTLAERLYANIEPLRGGRVSGVVYATDDDGIAVLDKYEGFPTAYQRTTVTVHMDAGIGAGKPVLALAYVMTESARRERCGMRYPEEYRRLCSAGAIANGIADRF